MRREVYLRFTHGIRAYLSHQPDPVARPSTSYPIMNFLFIFTFCLAHGYPTLEYLIEFCPPFHLRRSTRVAYNATG